MATVQKSTIPVAGLWVNVYTDPDIAKGANLPVAAVFVLHGRLSSAKSSWNEQLIQKVFDHVKEQGDGTKVEKDLVVLTIDQRNHGTRMIHPLSNQGWEPEKHNEKHAVDMLAGLVGTARDVSFIIDFLPAYLYPSDERQIVDWGAIGISQGGRTVYWLLRDEPRISMGVPIIGCPDYLPQLEARAKQYGVTTGPPVFPKTFREFVAKFDPPYTPYSKDDPSNPYLGKRILIINGAADTLVPLEDSKPFIDGLEVGSQGVKKIVIEEGVGHVLTTLGKEETAKFVWDWLKTPLSPSQLPISSLNISQL